MVYWIELSAQETEVVGSNPGHGALVLWAFSSSNFSTMFTLCLFD